MATRILTEDLPPKPAPGEATDYELRWKEGPRQRQCAFPEGEVELGSSSRCAACVSAPGVRPRHLRLRRLGDRVYVEPLAKAPALLNGKRLTRFSAWNPGEELTIGPVVFRLERLTAEGRRAAVAIDTAVEADAGSAQSSTGVHSGAMLTHCLQNTALGAASFDELLQGLWHSVTPASAKLLMGDGPDAVVLAQFTSDRPVASQSERSFEAIAGQTRIRLVVQFDDDGELDREQREICEQFAWLALVWHRLATGREVALAATPATLNIDQIWSEFAGARIREHLAAYTEMCRVCETVLVLGETGTGKELAARSLHRLWGRSGPFIAINCAALPADLLDAELFGMEAGAATGVTARPGRIEQAEKGTLFLDEVTDIPIHLQTKLLRVLSEREFFRVGGQKLRYADVKIVAATNRPADTLTSGHLRPDLYFRLAQATVWLPPLRERLSDLPAICERFLTSLERQFQNGIRGLSVSALDALKAHGWPGNIRELQNVLRGLYAAAPRGGVIQALHLPDAMRQKHATTHATGGSLAAMVESLERREIADQLARHQQVGAAARALGLSEGYLYRKMRKLNLMHPGKNSRHQTHQDRSKD